MSEIRIPFEMLIDYTLKLERDIKDFGQWYRDLVNKYKETKLYEAAEKIGSRNWYTDYGIDDIEYEQRSQNLMKLQFDTYKRLLTLCQIAETQDIRLTLFINWKDLRDLLIRFNPSYDSFDAAYKRLFGGDKND